MEAFTDAPYIIPKLIIWTHYNVPSELNSLSLCSQLMSENHFDVIVNEIRAYLRSADDLKNLRFKTVRRAVERRLNMEKGFLDCQKSQMKDLIVIEARNILCEQLDQHEHDQHHSSQHDQPMQSHEEPLGENNAFYQSVNHGHDDSMKLVEETHSDKDNIILGHMQNRCVNDSLHPCGKGLMGSNSPNSHIMNSIPDSVCESLDNPLSDSIDHYLYPGNLVIDMDDDIVCVEDKKDTLFEDLPVDDSKDMMFEMDSIPVHEQDFQHSIRLYTSTETEPRKCCSAYVFFCAEHRASLKRTRPELSHKEVLREIGKEWRMISSEERQKYIDLCEVDKMRYQKELREWNEYLASHHIEHPMDENTLFKQNCLHPQQPSTHAMPPVKKARSAYIFYCWDNRKRIRDSQQDLKPTQISCLLGDEWNALCEEEKDRYRKMEQDDRMRYLRDLQQLGIGSHSSQSDSRPRKSLLNSVSKAKSAFTCFCALKKHQMADRYPELTQQEITQRLSQLWQLMPWNERVAYAEGVYGGDIVRNELEKAKLISRPPIHAPIPKPKRAKRARSPYTFFYIEQHARLRDKLCDISFGDMSRVLANCWKELKPEDKRVYLERSQLEMETLASQRKMSQKQPKKRRKRSTQPMSTSQTQTSDTSCKGIINQRSSNLSELHSSSSQGNNSSHSHSDNSMNVLHSSMDLGRLDSAPHMTQWHPDSIGFASFFMSKETEYKRLNSNMNHSEFILHMRNVWNELDPNTRKSYEDGTVVMPKTQNAITDMTLMDQTPSMTSSLF